MDELLGQLTIALLAILLATLAVSNWRTPRVFAALSRRVAADPRERGRLYRRLILGQLVMVAFVPLVLVVSPQLSPSDIGWTRPSGDGLDYVLAAIVLCILIAGNVRARLAMRRGEALAARAAFSTLVPRSAVERWLAVGISLSAGVSEELVYRGLLIAAGTELLHLPAIAVAAASLALFVWAHAYQGRLGMIGSGVIGLALTAIFLISGSLLLPVLVHVCHDLMALLLVPAQPSPATPRTEPGAPKCGTCRAAAGTGHTAGESAVPVGNAAPVDRDSAEPPSSAPTLRSAAPR